MHHPSRRATALFVLLALATLRAPAAAEAEGTSAEGAGVQITYLANEGFLLEAGETKVLIDALFGEGLREYPAVPTALRVDLENARGRFAGVDLILVSHAHADHFDPAAVARHLRANPAAAFLSTREAAAALRDELGEHTEGLEIVSTYPDQGASRKHRMSGVTVEALNLHHGHLPIENLGLIVRLGGIDLLHVGDTSAGAPALRPYASQLETVDVWMLADWLLTEPAWQTARERSSGETWLVVMHLLAPSAPPSWFGATSNLAAHVASIRELLPDAWVPLEALATRHYPPAAP